MNKEIDLDLSGKTSYVYFLRIGEDGPIKIGFTKRIRHRLAVIQVGNPVLVYLLSVFVGGSSEEKKLHKQFEKYKIYGEWFEPNEELLNFIKTLKPLNLISPDFQSERKRGPESNNWKGENVLRSSKMQRARAYTRYVKFCERCKKAKAIDTVYKDGNENNLSPDNIVKYCRRCRMELDGTLNILNSIPRTKTFTPCIICGKITNKHWYGRCHSCDMFWKRNKFERTEKRIGPKDPVNCSVCGKLVQFPANGRCHACYEFFRRNGYERSEKLKLNVVTDDVLELRKLDKTTIAKVDLIRKMYLTGKYTNNFLSETANISKSYLNLIIRNQYFINDEYAFKTIKQIKAEINNVEKYKKEEI